MHGHADSHVHTELWKKRMKSTHRCSKMQRLTNRGDGGIKLKKHMERQSREDHHSWR